jgi:hypothetical protein
MSKPCLRLVHSSNSAKLVAVRQRDRSFRPLVVQGGAQAKSARSEGHWEAALELINLGARASWANYVALLQASIAVLEVCNRTDPEN